MWASLRYRKNLNDLENSFIYDVEIPEEWLGFQMKKKTFTSGRAVEYVKNLAADIAYNQRLFQGKRKYWFRPLCEQLGWVLSDNFADRFRISLMAVCVDPDLIYGSTSHIKGPWGTGPNRALVKESLMKVVKDARRSKKILYPHTFKLFENLFPWIFE